MYLLTSKHGLKYGEILAEHEDLNIIINCEILLEEDTVLYIGEKEKGVG